MTFPVHSDYLRLCQTNPQNLWFFTVEDVRESAFKQRNHILTSIGSIKYLGLAECLAHAHYRTQFPGCFDYYMLSQSTKKAIRLTSDKSVFTTWKKHCRKDSIVQIIMRPRGSPTPDQFHAYSHNESLAERKAVVSKLYTSSQPKLPEIDLRPTIFYTDLLTAVLRMDDGTCMWIERKHLLDTINQALCEEMALIDLPLDLIRFSDPNRKIKTITLDTKIWKQLARGLWKADFACVLKSYNAEVKMKVRKEGALWQFLIRIGLVGPGNHHVCDKCKREIKPNEKEGMLFRRYEAETNKRRQQANTGYTANSDDDLTLPDEGYVVTYKSE
jgi:hypothetical protein